MGCTNSKERPRTPPPDAALQNVVSDGDGFWAANGEQRASREATPLKAAADPFQTVDLTNPETAAAASDGRGPSARGGGPGGRDRNCGSLSACDGGGRGAPQAVADKEAVDQARDARRPQEEQQKEEERKQKEVRTTPPSAHSSARVRCRALVLTQHRFN